MLKNLSKKFTISLMLWILFAFLSLAIKMHSAGMTLNQILNLLGKDFIELSEKILILSSSCFALGYFLGILFPRLKDRNNIYLKVQILGLTLFLIAQVLLIKLKIL